LREWSISERKIVKEFNLGKVEYYSRKSDFEPYHKSFSNDGKYLTIFGSPFMLRIFGYSNGKFIVEFNEVSHSASLCSFSPMAFSPDGEYFASGTKGYLCLYETDT
jgi:WD40 repeat protein